MSEYINLDEGLNRVRGNHKLYGRMLGMFLESPEFEQMEAALAAQDWSTAAAAAHAIKGVSGNLSLTQLFSISERLVEELRQGPANPATLEQYRQTLSQTREAVEQARLRFD